MKDIDDFVFKNIQCSAICLAKDWKKYESGWVRCRCYGRDLTKEPVPCSRRNCGSGCWWFFELIEKTKSVCFSSNGFVRIEKTTLSDLRRTLLNGLSEDLESQPLNHNVRSTLIGIGNFLLYSCGKFAAELVPLLIKALALLPQLKWVDDGLLNKNDRVPIQEQFAFCFNTVLSDLASHLPAYRDVIVSAQMSDYKTHLAMVFSENPEIPRISSDDTWTWLDGGPVLTDKETSTNSIQRLAKLYNKFGASFVYSYTETKEGGRLLLNNKELESLFDTVQQILKKEVLTQLDNHATDVYTGSLIKRFPYKTVSETLTLACLSMLREVLRPFSVLSKGCSVKENFAKELNAFVVHLLGQLEAQRQSLGERRTTPAGVGRRSTDLELPRHSISILAATCALELIVWAAVDDIDSDAVCSTMSARLFVVNTSRVQLSQLPLSLRALSSLGGRNSSEKKSEERRQEETSAKRKSALDALRNAAIDALCRYCLLRSLLSAFS
ncbi:unnamed protein product [Haemonchus placei]|uniref:HECT domain-containing protein n=1 Tax=Haemonchus placei TaxID=6290 RepID=A0A0N4W7J2_HAEPC|nr:unnamed protein product [Haemonchus placei]